MLTINVVRTGEMMKKAVLIWLAASAISAVIGTIAIQQLDGHCSFLIYPIYNLVPPQGLPAQQVPEDPHGNLGLSRLRRTLAWHIARRPGGLIALAIQYGHMRTALDARTSAGYGSRERRGFHGELDVETALAAAAPSCRPRASAIGPTM